MNAQLVRAVLRWVALASSSGAICGVIYGLRREPAFSDNMLWLAAISQIAILSTWAVVESMVACKDEILAAMPAPRSIVRATLEEIEEQAARDAGLPQIADGQRTR